jgi:hypothetical protein
LSIQVAAALLEILAMLAQLSWYWVPRFKSLLFLIPQEVLSIQSSTTACDFFSMFVCKAIWQGGEVGFLELASWVEILVLLCH